MSLRGRRWYNSPNKWAGGDFMKVLNYGSLNYDFVYQVDHITAAGETQASEQRKTFCGGKGLNQSIALAKAGAKVYQGGTVGAAVRCFSMN